MSGYQVVVIYEPFKDAWFETKQKMLEYVDELKEDGYIPLAWHSTPNFDVFVMSYEE